MANAAQGMAATDTYLFGRKTYQIMAAHWPTAPSDDPFAGHLKQLGEVCRVYHVEERLVAEHDADQGRCR